MNNRAKFPRPQFRSVDDLGIIADVGLEELEDYFRSQVGRGRATGFNTYEWEVELCYIQRELEIRELRVLVHKQWLEEQRQVNPDNEWDNVDNNGKTVTVDEFISGVN
jgi:hypothetical protein